MSEPWDMVKAKQMRDAGYTLKHVAEIFGITGDTLKRWIDPAYRAKRVERVAEMRRMRESTYDRRPSPFVHHLGAGKVREEDVAARLAEIPPDTRNLTQRICGDPLPGRDALSRARGA